MRVCCLRSLPSRGKVVVVGAGPAGVLASIYLAQQQYDVDVSCYALRTGHVHSVLIMRACRHHMSLGHHELPTLSCADI